MDEYEETYFSYLEAQRQDESLSWEQYAAIAMVSSWVRSGNNTRMEVGIIRGHPMLPESNRDCTISWVCFGVIGTPTVRPDPMCMPTRCTCTCTSMKVLHPPPGTP